jgi:hypothetical protein
MGNGRPTATAAEAPMEKAPDEQGARDRCDRRARAFGGVLVCALTLTRSALGYSRLRLEAAMKRLPRSIAIAIIKSR